MEGSSRGEQPAGEWILRPVSGGAAGGVRPGGYLDAYLGHLVDCADHLEFGDPAEYLATLGIQVPDRARLADVWAMPMVRQLALGEIPAEPFQSAGVELRPDRVLIEHPEPFQVVLGGPGYGKTTLCRYLASDLAARARVSGSTPLPIFVQVRRITDFPVVPADEQIVRAALAGLPRLSEGEAAGIADALGASLDHVCLIFDGFDEAPASPEPMPGGGRGGHIDRKSLYNLVLGFRRRHPRTQVVLTSRELEYTGSPQVFGEARHYGLTGFSPQQVDSVIRAWHDAAAKAARMAGRELPDWPARMVKLRNLARYDQDLGQLATVPLLLGIMQVVFRADDHIPRNTSELVTRAIHFLMIENPRFEKGSSGPSFETEREQGILLAALRRLAFTVTESLDAGGSSVFTPGQIFEAVDIASEQANPAQYGVEPAVDPGAAVRHIEGGNGVIVRTGPRRFEFSHNVFRDVLAGQHLDLLHVDELKSRSTRARWLLPLRYWAGWKAQTRDTAAHVCLVAGDLLDSSLDETSPGPRNWVALVAVAEIAAELIRHGSLIREFTAVKRLRQNLVEELVSALDQPELELSFRIRIGDLLGALGDPRVESLTATPGHLIASFVELPGSATVVLGRPAAHFVTRNKYLMVPSHPPFTAQMGPIAASMYPLTNLQYGQFINAGGYADAESWGSTEAGLWAAKDPDFVRDLAERISGDIETHYGTELQAGRVTVDDLQDIATRLVERSKPLYWEDPRFNHPNQPVVGISFWEARAYCRWLTRQLNEAGVLDDSTEIRLPTEFEWEYVARCGSNHPFPWGAGRASAAGTQDAHIRDHESAKIGRTCAVGSFPWARWAGGPLDLVGNVWEWTLSSPATYPTDVSRVDPDPMAEHVTRGSSWLSQEPESVEVTFRTFDPPYYAYEDLGMRLFMAERPSASN